MFALRITYTCSVKALTTHIDHRRFIADVLVSRRVSLDGNDRPTCDALDGKRPTGNRIEVGHPGLREVSVEWVLFDADSSADQIDKRALQTTWLVALVAAH